MSKADRLTEKAWATTYTNHQNARAENEIVLAFCAHTFVHYCQCGMNYGCTKCPYGVGAMPCKCRPPRQIRLAAPVALLFAFFFFTATAYGQCPEGSVCVSQTTVNKCSEVADKLRIAEEAIQKFKEERGVTDVERKAATALIDSFQALLRTKDSIITEYEKINALYVKVIEFQNQIILNLEKQLNKPKSGWQKFLKALKEIALVIGGIAIGRAGI